MAERLSLPEVLAKPRDHIVICTFGAQLDFYEGPLWRYVSRAHNRIVLADDVVLAGQLADLASGGSRLRHVNRHYLATPITNAGSAHAKLILLVDGAGGTLLVGSGNLGIDGYASRGEVFYRYDITDADETYLPEFQAAKALLDLMAMRGYIDSQARQHLDAVWTDTPWIWAPAGRLAGVCHNLVEPLGDQLVAAVATALANWLNDTGRRSRRGGLWTNQTVLRLLRNPVYVGKISHDETVHEGKHEPILDDATFNAAQQILNERAAESTALAPTTSEYLLTGLVRCLACEGAYVGVSAHGRSSTYRYYACRTRQVSGARGCPGHRVPADDLEAAVIDTLLSLYGDLNLFEDAIHGAYEDSENERPRLEDELASTEAQLRDTTASIDRYLRAFEAGTMPETICAPRVAELSDRRTELTAHRDQLQVQLRTTAPATPSRQELEGLAAKARNALTEGSPEQIKQTLAALVDRVEISADRRARPWFKIPSTDTNRPGPSLARACGTPVRMGPRQVEVSGLEPPTSTLRTWRSAI